MFGLMRYLGGGGAEKMFLNLYIMPPSISNLQFSYVLFNVCMIPSLQLHFSSNIYYCI